MLVPCSEFSVPSSGLYFFTVAFRDICNVLNLYPVLLPTGQFDFLKYIQGCLLFLCTYSLFLDALFPFCPDQNPDSTFATSLAVLGTCCKEFQLRSILLMDYRNPMKYE